MPPCAATVCERVGKTFESTATRSPAPASSSAARIPEPPAPIANFVTHAESGRLIFLSGQGPLRADGTLCTGKVGHDVTVEQAYEHARLTGLNLLAVMHAAAGDPVLLLRHLQRVLRAGLSRRGQRVRQRLPAFPGCVEVVGQLEDPAGVLALQVRLEAFLHLPVRGELVARFPQINGEPGEIGRAQRCGFKHLGSHYRDPEQIGLELHQ